MQISPRLLKQCGHLFYISLFSCIFPCASQAVTISQQPIYLQDSDAVEPNIMFTIDDSGSMRRYYLSNGQIDGDHIVPEDKSPYDYAVNTMYYNPEVTYSSWENYTGDLKTNTSVTTKTNFPTTTEANINCDQLVGWTTAGEKPSFPGRSSDYTKRLDADPEYNRYVQFKNYYGEGYQCFYYENTTLQPYSSTYIHGEYTGGTLVPIASQPYYLDAEGKTKKINDNRIPNKYIRQNRTDCQNPQQCTYAEEKQNYINWLLYYSNRIKVAKGSIGKAFSQLDNSVRVGFGKINSTTTGVDGSTKGTVLTGVRKFEGAARTNFFSTLYNVTHSGGTPMRRAFDDVGQYFKLDKPWFDDPTNATDTCKTCRQSFHIVMTDGYWKDDQATTADARANVDNTNGEYITNDNGGSSIRYVAQRPYLDSSENTLSDVATYYWKNDLKPTIRNKISTSSADPAYWQHLPIFAISFGVKGTLSATKATLDSLTKSLADGGISWPEISANEYALEIPKKLDDLWHATVNSRGSYFSVKNISEFVTALKNAFAQIQARVGSSSSIASNSTKLNGDTAIYQAKFNTANWTGDLTAYEINEDTQSVGDALWAASNELPSAANRHIYTLANSGRSGTQFTWNNLTNEQKSILNSTDSLGESRLSWIRGDQSKETTQSGGMFRSRNTLLGDIINSNPVLVSNQYYGYGDSAFTTTKASRTPMVYVGANDGMLHGFDAETGEEKFAYIPQGIFANLPLLMATSYASNHHYFVDGSPKVGDAEISNQWKTVLLGSTGAGGHSVFALDVTDPSSLGNSTVLWEFNADNANDDMGYTIPQPTFSQLQGNSTWSALIANGYNSTSNQAKLILRDLANGSDLATISTNEGSATYPNGLSTPIPVDINNDHKADYAYAGDLRGNLWRFDFTDASSSNWTVKKIFTACSSDTCTDNNRQPITIRPEVVTHKSGGVLVLFGTGSDFATEDRSSTQTQTMYAVRDTLSADPTVLHRTDLVEQTITSEPTINGAKYRVISQNTVDYSTKSGWYLNLISPGADSGNGERIINNLTVDSEKVIFTTMIPSTDPCDYGGKSWLMELSLMTGKPLTYAVFDVNGDGTIDDNDTSNGSHVSGKGYDDVINTPTIIKDGSSTTSDGGTETKYISSSSGAIHKVREKSTSTSGGRQSWQQLR
ncbi:MAG: PilC/PilY family type IV pilus protein [Tolumonas sp.]|nr:PilC/PilY family type IV pilus protein [Tolumonas sp.]